MTKKRYYLIWCALNLFCHNYSLGDIIVCVPNEQSGGDTSLSLVIKLWEKPVAVVVVKQGPQNTYHHNRGVFHPRQKRRRSWFRVTSTVADVGVIATVAAMDNCRQVARQKQKGVTSNLATCATSPSCLLLVGAIILVFEDAIRQFRFRHRPL